MSRRSSLQSTRHRTRKRTKVRSTYKTGECLQFSVCLQALSCFFCVPEKRPRCGGRASLDGVAARGLVNGGTSEISNRVAKRSSDLSSARGPCPQVLQWHPRVAKRASIGTLARRPYPQVLQRHPGVAKGTSIGTSARRPSTEALLGQGRVSKERESVPLTGLGSGSRPGLARHPRLQVVLRHPGVAKGTSIGTSARRPYQQAPQWYPRGATVSWCIG